jgi:hypothetical protein
MKLLAKFSKSKTFQRCSKTTLQSPLVKDGTCARRSTLKNLRIILNFYSAKSPSKNWDTRKVELKDGKLVKLKQSPIVNKTRAKAKGVRAFATHTYSLACPKTKFWISCCKRG